MHMPDDKPRNALSAQLEILNLALRRILSGKVGWQNDPTEYLGYLGEDIIVAIDGDASRLVNSTVWDKIAVREGGKEIATFFYPSLSNKIQGLRVVPEEIQPKVDQIFSNLQRELIDNEYGPALKKLRALD
jgi:hypothetical protein